MHLCDKAVRHGLLFSGMSDVVQMRDGAVLAIVLRLSVTATVFGGFMTAVDGFKFCCAPLCILFVFAQSAYIWLVLDCMLAYLICL